MEDIYEKSIFDEEKIPVIYGGFGERFGALFLDWLILIVTTVIINYVLPESLKKPVSPILQVLVMAYKPLLEYLYGATPGKKALSLTVVNGAYGKINLIEAVLRNIFGIIIGVASLVGSFTMSNFFLNAANKSINTADVSSSLMMAGIYGLVILCLYLADAICLVANNQKQSLHDLIAKTFVIRK